MADLGVNFSDYLGTYNPTNVVPYAGITYNPVVSFGAGAMQDQFMAQKFQSQKAHLDKVNQENKSAIGTAAGIGTVLAAIGLAALYLKSPARRTKAAHKLSQAKDSIKKLIDKNAPKVQVNQNGSETKLLGYTPISTRKEEAIKKLAIAAEGTKGNGVIYVPPVVEKAANKPFVIKEFETIGSKTVGSAEKLTSEAYSASVHGGNTYDYIGGLAKKPLNPSSTVITQPKVLKEFTTIGSKPGIKEFEVICSKEAAKNPGKQYSFRNWPEMFKAYRDEALIVPKTPGLTGHDRLVELNRILNESPYKASVIGKPVESVQKVVNLGKQYDCKTWRQLIDAYEKEGLATIATPGKKGKDRFNELLRLLNESPYKNSAKA